MEVVGADGTKGGWIAVRLTNGRFEEARFFPEFDALLRAFPMATAITVDIPIGLPVRGRRRADLEAKRVLESLRNSVFFVPPRPALEAPTFEEAVRIARSLGSSMSQQIYSLRHKIFEVDGLASDRRIVEVHPEVSFWALNKSSALKHMKKSWNGLMKRLELPLMSFISSLSEIVFDSDTRRWIWSGIPPMAIAGQPCWWQTEWM